MVVSEVQQHRRVAAWSAVIVATIIMSVVWIAVHGSDVPIDLKVYRVGGDATLQLNDDLYSLEGPNSLPFTYPPFGAMLFAPFAAVPGPVSAVLLYFTSALCLVRIGYLTFDRLPVKVSPWVPTVLSLLALSLEPVGNTFQYGQVNLWLVWAVMEDLLGPHERKWRGALVGIAMGFKLTPGIFLLYLLVTKQWRASMVAALSGAATGVLGFLVFPRSSWQYWTGVAFDSTRVGGVAYVSNQSIQGMLWRLIGEGGNRIAQYLLSLLVLALTAWVCIQLFQKGLELESILVAEMSAILVSPISWSHHFVWVFPIIAALAVHSLYTKSKVLMSTGYLLAGALFLLTATWAIWLLPNGDDVEYTYSWWQMLIGDGYGLSCLAGIVWFAFLGRDREPAV